MFQSNDEFIYETTVAKRDFTGSKRCCGYLRVSCASSTDKFLLRGSGTIISDLEAKIVENVMRTTP